MTLGEKIKNARKAKKLTQARLAKNKITRNMLSRIENGSANPSLDTIKYLAAELSLPTSYFLSDDDDMFFYEKKESIKSIHAAFSAKDYEYCVKKISSFSNVDSELAMILTVSYFELGKESIRRGSLNSALNYLRFSLEYSEKTLFDTSHITTVIPMYRSIATNIQSPLLEFSSEGYENGLYDVFDYDLYKFLIHDFNHKYKNEAMQKHATAKILIKERNYKEALRLLNEAADINRAKKHNAYIMFGLYSDMELCYKQLYDFENAYIYSSKRMSMLEGFKS